MISPTLQEHFSLKKSPTMWKKIKSIDSVSEVRSGNIISKYPTKELSEFKVQSINDGFVFAEHLEHRIPMKIFPVTYLYHDNWWVDE